MSRRKKAVKRQILPDPKFNNVLVTRFINSLMVQGKKSVAERIFYDSIDLAQERAGQEGIDIFQKAVENVKPVVMILSRRIGGTPYQIPVEVRYEERTSRAIRWLIRFARERSGKGFAEKLAAELMAAAKGEGAAVKRKEDTHRMAEANRAFAHFKR